MAFNLLDSFMAKGSDLSEFTELLEEIDSCTKAIPVEMTDMAFLSLRESDDNDSLIFNTINAEKVISGSLMPNFGRMTVKKLEDKGVSSEIINELRDKTKLFIRINNAGYWVSENLSLGLAARADLMGGGAYNPCDELYYLLMRRYVDMLSNGTMVIRVQDNVKKIFACFSSRYHHVPQKLLTSIINGFKGELGRAECSGWEVSQFYTDIIMEFPDVADDFSKTYNLKDTFVPGIRLSTSDTGASSIRAVGTMRYRKSRIYTDEFSRKHSGSIDLKKLQEDVDDAIFKNFTKLPSRLCALMAIDIYDPADCTERILQQIGLEGCVGKRIAQKLIDEVIQEINPSVKYTAYDIATSILELPGRYYDDGATSTVDRLASLVPKAAYADYDKANRPIVVTLTA